jgi:pro-kumamolisin-like protein
MIAVPHLTHAAAPSRVTLPGHIVPALKHTHPKGPTAGAQKLQLAIALNPRNATGLKALIAQQSDKTSPLYHHYLTSAEYTQQFAPSQATVDAVVAYLRSQGLHIGSVSTNRMLIHADAPVSVVERAFQTQLSDFTLDGRTVFAPATEPSVPDTLAGMIVSVGGLSNTAVYHTNYQFPKHNVGPQAISPHAGSFGGYYTPADLRKAYDMNSLTASYTGAGQTVGIFELDGYLPSDINYYLSYFGLGSAKYSNVLIDGATNTPGAGAIEVELDMEVVSAIAPGANQKIYIGQNTGPGIVDTYNQMVTDNVAKVNSSSWGLCEAFSGTSFLQTLDNIFAQGASQGQAFFAASGDAGAYDCGDSNLGVDSPADDPYVVGVGGTNLQTDSSQNYIGESVWSCPSCSDRGPMGDGGGGGLSSYFTMPNYQVGPNVVNQNSNGYRQVPDVSADADPDTGYIVYCTVSATGCVDPSCPTGCWWGVGGTSGAAPLWAAIAADINQYLAAQSTPTLGNALAMLYQLFNTPQTYTPYHDVTSGNNLYYSATSGYDLASGIGTPDVWNLARDAAASGPARSVSKTWYFAEGYTGGSFTEYLTLANPNPANATVTVKYLLQGQAPITQGYGVSANSRQTLNVNTQVGMAIGVSMVVTSDIPIIAERPMYFTFTGAGLNVPGGTDVLGATSLGTQFDFGYLDTTANHATYLTVLNQNSSSMDVTVNYYAAAGGAPTTVLHSVPANSRGTILVNDDVSAGSYSALVTLSAPGLVERPMYLTDATTGYTGSADVIGVSALQTNWYFAEGYTGGVGNTFSERYILFNPSASATANTTVTFLRSNGTTATANISLTPGAQGVVDANSVLGAGVNNSATVTSDQPILAERFMSFSYLGTIPGATDVIGTASPGYIYYFAEGYTGTGFSEYLTLENPDPTNTAYVVVKYLPQNSGNGPVVRVYTVGPHSRYTVNVNSALSGQPFQSVSMIVQSGLPIVAERPMYFNYNNSGQTGGTDVLGYQP